MPSFSIRYVDSSGRRRKLVIQADSRYGAASAIPGDGTTLLEVQELVRCGSRSKAHRPSSAFILELTQSLALLLHSGLDIRAGLEIARSIFRRGKSAFYIAELAGRLDRGDSFFIAASRLGFPAIYTGLVRIGEQVGSLAEILPAMAGYLKSRQELKDKIVDAMLYPSLVLTTVLLGSLFLTIFAAPKIGDILIGFGQDPEQLAGIRIRMHLFALSSVVFGGGTLLTAAVIIMLRVFFPAFRLASDRAVLGLPLIGSFLVLQDTVNLVFALQLLCTSGEPLEDALELTADVTANRAYTAGLRRARESILRGTRPSEAFRECAVFPERLVRWLSLSERSGRVDEVFSGLLSFYQGEFETFLARISGLAEPALIILTGLLLLAGVVIFVLPLLAGFGNLL